MSTEIWKDIVGYEGLYQASNMGRIKNLERKVKRSRGGTQILKEKILRQFKNKSGYNTVALSQGGIPKTKYVHRLVMLAFHGQSDKVIDHINGIKNDNSLVNLRYVSQRENLTSGHNKRRNKYPGVSINPPNYKKPYRARIRVNDKLLELGSFFTEKEAHNAWLAENNRLISLSK